MVTGNFGGAVAAQCDELGFEIQPKYYQSTGRARASTTESECWVQENELTGARVLSFVGSQLRSHMQPADLAVFTKNVPPILRQLCSSGSAAAAKASSR